MPRVSIGSKRRRVALQQFVSNEDQRDSVGRITEEWATVATVWANVVDRSGGEQFMADQVQAEASVLVQIRYRSGITPGGWRIVDGARILDVNHVARVSGKNIQLDILCTEAK